MRVITIKQPFASLIMHGFKKIETRGWIPKNPKIIEQIKEEGLLIHASKQKAGEKFYKEWLNQLPKEAYESFSSMLSNAPTEYSFAKTHGAIIGKVDVVDFIESDRLILNLNIKKEEKQWLFDEQELAFGDYSENRFGWLLSNPIIFEKPIPVKGQLGLWNFDINDYNINSIAKF